MKTKTCPTCDGKQYSIELGGERTKCFDCLGRGYIIDEPAPQIKIKRKRKSIFYDKTLTVTPDI
jgi:DnaJ-class molecular chaperone